MAVSDEELAEERQNGSQESRRLQAVTYARYATMVTSRQHRERSLKYYDACENREADEKKEVQGMQITWVTDCD